MVSRNKNNMGWKKRGMWRVIEAVIAILILAGGLLVIASKQINNQGRDLIEDIGPVLEEIAKDSAIREDIIKGDNNENVKTKIIDKLEKRTASEGLEYKVIICGYDEGDCLKDKTGVPIGERVYSDERLISATKLQGFDPKVIKVYVWEKDS